MSAAPAGRSEGASRSRFDPSIRTGIGRVLVFLYAVFAVGTVSRSVVQIATVFHEAPLAYTLSAVSAVIYVVATVALILGWRGLAVAACAFEFVGVLVVGALTVADTAAFPDQTVWSDFGQGYLFIPVVLPLAGLWWLLRGSRRKPKLSGTGERSGTGELPETGRPASRG
jgi:hypothetical protein